MFIAENKLILKVQINVKILKEIDQPRYVKLIPLVQISNVWLLLEVREPISLNTYLLKLKDNLYSIHVNLYHDRENNSCSEEKVQGL